MVEQDPKNLEGHRALIALALQVQDFATAAESVAEAYAIAPDDPEIRAYKATVDYRAGDTAAAVAMARRVAAEDPAIVAAQMVLIADRLAAGQTAEALAMTDAALAQAPADASLHLVRLRALEETRRHRGRRRRARSAWPSSSPTTRGCAGR